MYHFNMASRSEEGIIIFARSLGLGERIIGLCMQDSFKGGIFSVIVKPGAMPGSYFLMA